MNRTSNIDFSNLKNMTDSLKKNLKEKYNDLEKITKDAQSTIISSGGGASSGGTGELDGAAALFFNQGTSSYKWPNS